MSKDKREGWLADIKVGDTITWTSLYPGGGDITGEVWRITPTGQIVCGDMRFSHKGWRKRLDYCSRIRRPEGVLDAE